MKNWKDIFKLKNNNDGITLISVLIMLVIIFIIASIAITGGLSILNNSKDSNKDENLAAVKAAVNKVSLKNSVGGVFREAKDEVYGKPAGSVFSSGDYAQDGWYILEKEDLEELGVTHVNETYIVNYKENKVYALEDFSGYLAQVASSDATNISGERKTYTVNFHPDDEGLVSGNMASQKFVYGISQKLSANNYKKDGYYFIAWNTQKDGSGTSYSDQQIVMNLTEEDEGVIDLYTIWGRGSYKIRFNANGGRGMMPDQEIRAGTDNNLSNNLFARTGYTYIGWNTKSDGTGTSYANNSIIPNIDSNSKTLVLFAQWQPNNYTLKFNANGGQGTMDDQIFTYDLAQNINANSFTREGYTFAKWNTKSDGTGTDYNNTALVTNLLTEGEMTLYAQWTVNTYTVSFDANSGQGSMESQTYTYDTTNTLPENTFTKTGYTFIGWNTHANNTGISYVDKDSVTNMITGGEITLFAQWRANTYTLTFNPGDGATVSPTSKEVTYDSQVGNLPTPVKTGHTFVKWSSNQNGTGETITEGTTYLTADNTTAYAIWSTNSYTIIFDPNGGRLENNEKTLLYGSALGSLPTPTRIGYTFRGWWTQPNGGNEISSSTKVPASVTTYYAHWTANTNTPYTVIHKQMNKDGNTYTTVETQNLTGTTDTQVTPAVKTYTGFTSPSAQTKKINGDGSTTFEYLYTRDIYAIQLKGWLDGDEIDNITGFGTIDVYIDGVKKSTNVSEYNYNCVYGTDYEIVINSTASGKKYNGLHSGNLAGKVGAENAIVCLDFTTQYTITYDLAGGSVDSENPTIYDIYTETFTLNNPTRTGYTFAGWTGTNGDTPQTNVTITKGSKGNREYTANWTANKYTLTFNPNGGSVNPTSKEVTYDSPIGDLPTPTRTGYRFVEWNKSQDGNGDNVTKETLYAIDGNLTVYAVWEINYYTITFDPNGGILEDNEKSLPYNSELGELPTPERTGYTFDNWWTSRDGGTQISSTTRVADSDATYYAHWTINQYTVTCEDWFVDSNNIPQKKIETYTKQVNYNTTVDGSEWGSDTALSKYHQYYQYKSSTSAVVNTNGATVYRYFHGYNIIKVRDPNGNDSTDGSVAKFSISYNGNEYLTNQMYGAQSYAILPYGAEVKIKDIAKQKDYYELDKVTWDGNTLTPSSGIYTVTYTDVGKALYINMKYKTYNVTYNYSTNGGSSATKTSASVVYGNAIDLSPTASKSGWNFIGWNTNSGATTKLNSLTMDAGDVTLYAIYSKTITATLCVYNNNSSTKKSETIYNTATAASINLGTTSLSGYTFRGWSTANTANATINVAANGNASISSDTTYYASYSYTVTNTYYGYFTSSYTNKTATATAYMNYVGTKVGGTPTAPAITTPSGWTNRGWSTSSGASASVATPGAVTDNTTYYYSWSKTITATKYVYNNSKSTATGTAYLNYKGDITNASIGLGTTSLSGYTFRGWSTGTAGNATINVAANGNASINANTTYYASYSYTVTATKYVYNNSKSTATGTAYMNYVGTKVNASINLGTTSLSGYTFRGWSTGTAGNATINVAANGNASINANTTYYASYSYTVTATKYVYNNSKSTATGTAYMNYVGTKVNASIGLGTTSLSGYTFRGWSTGTAGNSSISVAANGNASINANTTYYASYSYTVTATKYVYNNSKSTATGTAYMNYVGTKVNASIGLGTTSLSGYTFRGWSTGTAGNSSISVAANGNASINANTTYYAAYSYTVSISYSGNGSTSGTAPSATTGTAYMNYVGTKVGVSLKLAANPFSKTNYSYVYWNTNTAGTGTNYSASTSYTFSANATLYARWCNCKIDSTYYSSLQAAIDAAGSGKTVVLLCNTVDYATVASGKNITIDLNNKTLTYSAAHHPIWNKGTLTVKNGTVTQTAGYHTIGNEGTLTLNSVKINLTKDTSACGIISTAGRVTLNACTISSSGHGVACQNGAWAIINNSTIGTTGRQVCICNAGGGKMVLTDTQLTTGALPSIEDTSRDYIIQFTGISGGYRINLFGNYASASVIQLPTWGDVNGQNDIKWYNPSLYQAGNYELFIYKSNHGNETGFYNTHLYINGVGMYPGGYTVK